MKSSHDTFMSQRLSKDTARFAAAWVQRQSKAIFDFEQWHIHKQTGSMYDAFSHDLDAVAP